MANEHNLEDLSNAKDIAFSDNLVVNKKGSKKALIVVGLILLVIVVIGVFFGNKIKSFVLGGEKSVPTNVSTAEATPTPTPSPTSNPLVRSDLSFEVLNGSGESGLAKKISDELRGVGYQVVKSGNADKSDYKDTQIFIKDELKEKLDLVIADLKDIIKIASYAGELKDSTASARIIIGKDSI